MILVNKSPDGHYWSACDVSRLLSYLGGWTSRTWNWRRFSGRSDSYPANLSCMVAPQYRYFYPDETHQGAIRIFIRFHSMEIETNFMSCRIVDEINEFNSIGDARKTLALAHGNTPYSWLTPQEPCFEFSRRMIMNRWSMHSLLLAHNSWAYLWYVSLTIT